MKKTLLPLGAATVAIAIAGCGGSSSSSSNASKPAPTTGKEVNPAGDIPDNQAYVAYRGPSYSVKVPEGWSRTSGAGAVSFSDKLNSITVQSAQAGGAPTVASVKKTVVPKLAAKGDKVTAPTVVSRNGGRAVLVKFTAPGKPNPVTGKVVKDAVEQYTYFKNGRQVVLTLSGPVTADNVDPWKLVSNSLQVQ